MSTVGLIAEFNPLHTGHEYLLKQAKLKGKVVCVISGNFVQRGDTAIASKEVRAKSALLAGADLVAELPVLWSMSTAQNFALGGVSALVNLGCDTLIFGSEQGEIEPLMHIADILETEEFSKNLDAHLKEGMTFAKARQLAVEESGGEKGILDKPNNNLGIEYIVAAKRLRANLKFQTVKRLGADHDSAEVKDFVSATLLRTKLLSGDYAFCKNFMSENILNLYSKENLSDISRLETAILSVLRTRSLSLLSRLPDLSEGVENRLLNSIKNATSLDELYNELKVKRYPLSRIRRLVLSAFLGLDNELFMKPLPYVRILGKNTCGDEILREARKITKIPILMQVNELENLSDTAKKVFETEVVATNLYNLSLKKPQKCGKEYTFKIITEE